MAQVANLAVSYAITAAAIFNKTEQYVVGPQFNSAWMQFKKDLGIIVAQNLPEEMHV